MFRKYVGMPMSDYISNARIEKAASLLKDTDMSVNEVAAATGFMSTGYFIKVFKLRRNVTPMEFKMQSRMGKS